MEVALGGKFITGKKRLDFRVLILILVEVALGDTKKQEIATIEAYSLNPYFSGSCSWREWGRNPNS